MSSQARHDTPAGNGGGRYDLQEIAKALDVTKRAVEMRAEKEGWKFTIIPGRGRFGGSRLYSWDALPDDVHRAVLIHRRKLNLDPLTGLPPRELPAEMREQLVGHKVRLARTLAGEAPDLSPEAAWDRYERVPQRLKYVAQTRLKVLHRVDDLCRQGLSLTLAREQVAKEMREEGVKSATVASIVRWHRLVRGRARSDWLGYLVPGYKLRGRRKVEIDQESWDFFKSCYLRLERPSAEACYEWTLRDAKARGVEIPKIKTFVRRVRAEVEPRALILMREGEEAFNLTIPPIERDRSVFHAMEAVNVDGHKLDVFARWPELPNGKEIMRPLLIGVQDIYSGMILGFQVGWSETTELVQRTFYEVIKRYGIPRYVWMDNGRAFASKQLTGGVPTRYRYVAREGEPLGVLPALGCEIRWTTPYHGQSKPIERAWRDICERVAKHPAFAGAYTGNNPQAKPENYQSRAVPIEALVKVLEAEIRAHNARVGRRTPVCGGTLSFQQAFDASYAGVEVKRATEQQLRMLLQATEVVKVGSRSGLVTVAGNKFWSEGLVQLKGQHVQVRFDAEAIQAGVEVYALDGTYVGPAECRLPVGFNDRDEGRERQKVRKALKTVAEQQKALHRKLDAADVAQRLDALGAEALEPEAIAPVLGKRKRRLRKRAEQREAAVLPAPGPEEAAAIRARQDWLRQLDEAHRESEWVNAVGFR